MKRKTLLCAIMVAISALFVVTEVKAQLQSVCKTPGGITVTAVPKDTTSGNIVWNFRVEGNPQMINSVKDVVFVIHRPVAPADIVSPLPVRTYCDQSDINTRINRGNCDGFPLISIPLKPISTGLMATVITKSSVTEGLVTPTIVTGASNSEVCTATEGGVLTGIVGPGEKGDPFQPVFKEQTAVAAGGKCLTKLKFDSNGQLADVESLTPTCKVTPGDVFINGELLRNNTNPHGITSGNGTCTTYGPPYPSPSRTICG